LKRGGREGGVRPLLFTAPAPPFDRTSSMEFGIRKFVTDSLSDTIHRLSVTKFIDYDVMGYFFIIGH